MPLIKWTLLIGGLIAAQFSKAQSAYQEPYRPQVHFSPKEKWMNDPNGMVYYKGVYHLFFQYYPKDIVWGPMHWGHAISKDLIHWKQLPIALYPDSLGYIFSGSAVVDEHNTSGFGKNGITPLVAIFTHHEPKMEKEGGDRYQNESIAYSLDNGNTWTKYAGNPVLKNPGIKDFRDPNVRWYAPEKKWVMTLATKDRVTFYSSLNLKDWKKESDFGKNEGEHNGVWECPDLFKLKLNGKAYWVLLVSTNPGGPNGGSGTQYFIGNFDGKTFTDENTAVKWIDFGPDNYAGVTWCNTGDRKIFLGWMSNWTYANQVPTLKWRNAMTIPRELALKEVNGSIYLTSNPVKELGLIEEKGKILNTKSTSLKVPKRFVLSFTTDQIKDYTLMLSNTAGEQLSINYRKKDNTYFIDRSKAGKIDFNPDFVKISGAVRLTTASASGIKLLVDDASVELFADGGLSNMTEIFFTKNGVDHLQVKNPEGMIIKDFKITPLKSIWNKSPGI